MFNVYHFERKLSLKKKIDKMKEEYIKDQNRKKSRTNILLLFLYFIEKNEKLSTGYKKRVENFVLNVFSLQKKKTECLNFTQYLDGGVSSHQQNL